MKALMVLPAILSALAASPALAVVGGGDIILKNRGGDVLFSHDLHLAEADLKCPDCHAKLYLDAKNHAAVTMVEMQNGKSCGACHDGGRAFGVKAPCVKCHKQ